MTQLPIQMVVDDDLIAVPICTTKFEYVNSEAFFTV